MFPNRTRQGPPKARRRGRDRGTAILTVIIAMLFLMTLAGAASRAIHAQSRDVGRYEIYKDEFSAAETVLARAFGQIQFMISNGTPDFTTAVQNMSPQSMDGFDFDEWEVTTLFDDFEDVTSGWYAGLNLRRQRYNVQVRAKRNSGYAEGVEHPGVTLNQTIELTYIPLYIFAIFYDQPMEIAPGAVMQVNGRVHSNAASYFQANSSLDFLMRVSSAGPIYHGRHPAYTNGTSTPYTPPAPGTNPPHFSDGGGTVRFTDGSSLVAMNSGGSYLDARDSDWYNESNSTWNWQTDGAGNTEYYVQDQAHGVAQLNPPIPSGLDPHTLIERAQASDGFALRQEKFEYKAGLKILREGGSIVGRDQNGNIVPLTYPNPSGPGTVNVVSTTSFYDTRERAWVNSIDIDVGKLANAPVGGPLHTAYSNGILYASNEPSGSNPGVVRLKNASRLPVSSGDRGFSFITDDPLYVQGNYNTDRPASDRPPSLVASDALMILSNAWNDSNSDDGKSQRNASNTETNAVFMSGIVPSGSKTNTAGQAYKHYSGGVENYYRYLETWSGDRHTVNGSIVSLWASKTFRTAWNRNPNFPNGSTGTVGDIYDPPNRYWAWDTNLGEINGGPPGTTAYVEVKRTAWNRGEFQGS